MAGSSGISDVAARAGVSVATVSRALRGLPNVAPSTRERVLEAAAALNYVVDPHASRLAEGRTRTIGVVVPVVNQWYFGQAVAGIEGVLSSAGFDVLLYNLGGAGGRERFVSEAPFRKRVDGLVIVDVALDQPAQDHLAGSGLAIVLIGDPSRCLSTVDVDNVAAGAAATQHLVNLGHRDIALIAGLADDPLDFRAPVERRTGYHRALRASGIDVRPELDVAGNFSVRGGAEAMAQLLATDQPPTAVFAESDEMAIAALKTIRDAGLTVPEDISVIGFDDHELAEYAGLTTIAQPVQTLGETAADLLLGQLEDGRPHVPRHIHLPTQLRVRSTTGPVRRRPAVV